MPYVHLNINQLPFTFLLRPANVLMINYKANINLPF